MIVTAMLDSTSKRKQNKQTTEKQSLFGQMLEDERERLKEEARLEGKTIGYTKNGQVYVGQAMQREYR